MNIVTVLLGLTLKIFEGMKLKVKTFCAAHNRNLTDLAEHLLKLHQIETMVISSIVEINSWLLRAWLMLKIEVIITNVTFVYRKG